MPTLIPSETRAQSRRIRDFGAFYVATILLSFHWALVLYINSSFLEQYFSSYTISALYTLGSALSILFFLCISKMLRTIGNFRFLLLFTLIEAVTLLLFPVITLPWFLGALFVIHQIAVPLMLFSLDIFMEKMIGAKEEETGGKRGLFLTIISFTIAVSALLSGYLIGDTVPHYDLAYTTSALLLIPFLLIVARAFKSFTDDTYVSTGFMKGLASFWKRKDVRNVFCAHFILQLFFAWMVIYTPLYLNSILGFNWQVIGQILFVGLMAYVLFEYAIGVIADNWLGEKEMMAIGFLITAVATSWFVFLDNSSAVLWMIAMFMTRVGASLIEMTTESYFFKQTDGNDTALISFFRITRPLSYLVGAVLGAITLMFIPMNLLFGVLALLLIPGFFFSMALHDTR